MRSPSLQMPLPQGRRGGSRGCYERFALDDEPFLLQAKLQSGCEAAQDKKLQKRVRHSISTRCFLQVSLKSR
jgi:hypothetical protein